MSKDIIQTFGRIDGLVYLKVKDEFYEVNEIHMEGKLSEETIKIEMDCINLETKKPRKIKMTVTSDIMEAFNAIVQAEEETQSRQVLLFNVDKKEWHVVPITEDLKTKYPFLRKIDKQEYIT